MSTTKIDPKWHKRCQAETKDERQCNNYKNCSSNDQEEWTCHMHGLSEIAYEFQVYQRCEHFHKGKRCKEMFCEGHYCSEHVVLHKTPVKRVSEPVVSATHTPASTPARTPTRTPTQVPSVLQHLFGSLKDTETTQSPVKPDPNEELRNKCAYLEEENQKLAKEAREIKAFATNLVNQLKKISRTKDSYDTMIRQLLSDD